jgi:hypothetical protein
MSAIPQTLPQTLPLLLSTIEGKIATKRRIETQNGALHLTVLRLAAADEYSSPESVEVQSTQGLGAVGETVKLRVRLGGRPRSYDTTTDDGDKRRVQTADNRLTVVE